MKTFILRCATLMLFAIVAVANSAALVCHDHERSALLQFKQSFLINCNMSGNPASAYPKVNKWVTKSENESGDCCKWLGVECNKKTGHVIGLNLGNSCLYGNFLANGSLFKLIHLQKLDLSCNHFNFSQIPHSLGHLDKLTRLNLSDSMFSGQIPLEISKLTRLAALDLSDNLDPSTDRPLLHLTDTSLDKLVGNLSHLRELHLEQTDLSSPVSPVLANLTSLRVISLAYSNLYGEFPSSIFRLPHLETLSLSGNTDLVGSLPEIQQNSPLRYLYLELTGFSGELPSSIGGLASLEELILWNCYFSGRVPQTLGNLTQLTDLNLGYNAFTGYLPSSITNLSHLHSLDISKLQFNYRDLLTWLLKLKNINVLSLRGMDLAGEIPSSLANLTQITYLDLAENELTGSIPLWLANLTHLANLFLDSNQLQGPVPDEISRFTDLKALGLSSNDGLFANFNTFLGLKRLTVLDLSEVNLMFPPNTSANSSSVKFDLLGLNSCNLTEFPQFLRGQDELKYLSLSGNNIQGSIPQWFMNTAKESLLLLDLSDNSLTGFRQPVSNLPWSFLEVFDLSSNRLHSTLPTPPPSILVYRVSNNLITGIIPEQICNASSLSVLDISDNSMRGPVPQCLANQLSFSLVVLNLRGNNFDGAIPQTYRKSCKLKMINLSENKLNGKLPRSLTNCQALQVFDIGRNNISDTFPLWLGNLTHLQVLVLRHNNFQGRIASPEIGFHFPSLRIIDLSNNFYMGDLPSAYFLNWHMMRMTDGRQRSNISGDSVTINFLVFGVPYVQHEKYDYAITITNKGNELFYQEILNIFSVIDLSSNGFTGTISDSIGSLTGLQVLNLSNNNLAGHIPNSLSNIRELESLDLSQNMLSGDLPQKLAELTSLQVFSVSHNDLVGPIPRGRQFETFDNSSYEGNIGLCGSPLSKICEDIDAAVAPPTLANDETEDDAGWIVWVITSFGCVSGFVVGFVLGQYYITDRHHGWFMETFRRKEKLKRKPYREGRFRN